MVKTIALSSKSSLSGAADAIKEAIIRFPRINNDQEKKELQNWKHYRGRTACDASAHCSKTI